MAEEPPTPNPSAKIAEKLGAPPSAPPPVGYEKTMWQPTSPMDKAAVVVERFVTKYRVVLVYIILGALSYGFFQPLLPAILSPLGLVLALVAVVPIVAMLFYVRKRARLTAKQWELVIRTFLVAALIGSLAAFTNDRLGYLPPIPLYLFVVGPGEEIVKLAAVAVVAWKSEHFRGPLDGMLYGLAAGAGFAAMENVSYVINQGVAQGFEAGLSTAALRLIVSIPGHALWSATAGYFLGVAKVVPMQRRPLIAKGLLIAAVVHGVYDIMATYYNAIILFVGLAMHAGVAYYLWTKIKWQKTPSAAGEPMPA